MILRPIEVSDLEKLRKWRQGKGYMLRTNPDITEFAQDKWYKEVVSNRDSKYKFYALQDKGLIGYGCLEIDFINGYAELGLLIGNEFQRKGYGNTAVDILIDKATNYYRLNSVHIECYYCNPSLVFWDKVIDRYKGMRTTIPQRKFYQGKFWDSLYGVINEK